MEQYFQDIDDGVEGKTYSSSLFLQLCELIYAFAPLFKSFFLNHFNISYRQGPITSLDKKCSPLCFRIFAI